MQMSQEDSSSSLGARYVNPWRQLSQTEIAALMAAGVSKCEQHATTSVVNGQLRVQFACFGYSFLAERVATPESTYWAWYVYGTPGALRLPGRKRSEPNLKTGASNTIVPTVSSRPIPVVASRVGEPALSAELFDSLPRWSYEGSPAAPYPPAQSGWRDVAWEDERARGAAASLLGQLPVSEYTDVVLPTGGLYRFFAFETAMGAKSIGALEYVGAPLDASTLGADPSINAALDRAQNDLNAQAQGVVAIASAYITSQTPDYTQAVTSIQAIGNAAVSSAGISGEIDSAGFASVTQPITQQAWKVNRDQLSTIDAASADQGAAQTAQTAIGQMFSLFQQAISAARSANNAATPATPPPAPAGAPTTPSADLTNAAQMLMSYFAQNACSQTFVQEVYDFQVAYNKEGAVALGEDGYYGTDTQGALQRVLDKSGVGGIAPEGCVGKAAPGGGGGGGTTTLPTTTVTGGGGGTSWASVAAVGGGVITIAAIIVGAATGYIPNPFK